MAYWLFKSEPGTWSWQQQCARGVAGEPWDGVRNYLANNYMKMMVLGDMGFFYHSVKEKQIVGMVKVIGTHRPDLSDISGRFGLVDVMAIASAKRPVTLSEIKNHPELQEMALVKMARLSIQPVQPPAWKIICKLAGLESDQTDADY